MAPRMGCALLVVMAMLVAGATAQMDCTMAMASLQPCFTYVTGPDPAPSQVCCDGMKNVNSLSPECLCQVVATMEGTSGVNKTKAYALPQDCGVAVNTAQCPAVSAPPMPSGMPPLPVTAPPMPAITMPPGMSAPPMPDITLPPGMSAPPMPDITMPPGVSAPPMPDITMPPGVSAPPMPDVSMPPGLAIPPISAPPTPFSMPPGMSIPPSFAPPTTPVAEGPVADGPVTGGPVTGGPAAAISAASSLSSSIAFVVAVAGAIAALAM